MARKKTTTTTTVVTETLDDAPRKTLVTFLLDRTGSMETIKAVTISAFNEYLNTLEREAGDLVEFSLLQFDSRSVDKLYTGVALKNVARLNNETYQPRDMTPLIDACVKTIKATEIQVAQRSDNPRVVVVFQTDGDENTSHEYTRTDLAGLIKTKTAQGWQFVYMGANLDAYREASKMGIGAGSTVAYLGQNSGATFAATARNTARFASGARADMDYTELQKTGAGDQFDPLHAAKQAAKQGAFAKRKQAVPDQPKSPIVDDITL